MTTGEISHMGAQSSILTQQDAEKLVVRPGWQRVKVTGVNGEHVICQPPQLV